MEIWRIIMVYLMPGATLCILLATNSRYADMPVRLRLMLYCGFVLLGPILVFIALVSIIRESR